MSYKRLNIKNGDVINDYHINYLQDAISKISSEGKDFKERLAYVLTDKGIPAKKEDSYKDLLLKVNQLSNYPQAQTETAWPDIRQDIQSKHIRLLFKSGAACKFNLELSSSAQVIIDWGDNTTVNKYTLNKSGWIDKRIDASAGQSISDGSKVVVIDISLNTEDSSILRFNIDGNHTDTRNNLLWFCSKDIIFTNGTCMFNGWNYTTGSCRYLKYVDFIGGGITGSLDSFAWDCAALERVTGNLNPVGVIANAFRGCKKLKQLPPLDLNDITSANYLFYQCESLTEFNYYIKNNGTITNAVSMFEGCINLKRFVSDQKFNFSNATAQNSCFARCSSLLAAPTITFGSGAANNFFENCTLLTKVQDTISANDVTNVHSFFRGCASLIDGPSVFHANNATEANWLFYKCSSIKTVPTVLSFSKATSAYSLFEDCYSLEKAPTTIDLPVAINIYYMFRNCNTLKTAPVTIRANLATQAYALFEKCAMLITAPELNFPTALRIDYMFDSCSSLISGPNSIYAPNATNASYFFRSCSMLQNPGTRFEIGNNITNCNFEYFFYGCSALTSLPTEGDMHQGAKYNHFFAYAKAVNLPLNALSAFCNKGLSFPNATTLMYFAIGSNIRKISNINVPKCNDIQRLLCENSLLEEVGEIYAPVATNVGAMFYSSGASMTKLGKLTFNSVTNNDSYFDQLIYLKALTIENLRCNITLNNAKSLTSINLINAQTPPSAMILNFQNCNLNEAALNQLLNDLPNRANLLKGNINIKGNPGALTCNKQLGESKNWIVTVQ